MTMNELKEIADFCFPWSLVKLENDVIIVDHYSISRVNIDVDGIGGTRQIPGYIVIRENAPDENVLVECLSAQRAIAELAKALAADSVARAFEIYDPCLVVNPQPL
jgi:hypothetical protein